MHCSLWYERRVRDSWLAIVDERGLQTLVQENTHARLFLSRRVRRDGCLLAWIILELQHAEYIQCLLRSGYHRMALSSLTHLATDGGCVQVVEANLPQDYAGRS